MHDCKNIYLKIYSWQSKNIFFSVNSSTIRKGDPSVSIYVTLN
jgi:hypothetical protein